MTFAFKFIIEVKGENMIQSSYPGNGRSSWFQLLINQFVIKSLPQIRHYVMGEIRDM